MALSRQAKQQVLDTILLRQEPIEGNADLMSFLSRIWPLEQMPSEDSRFRTAAGDIHKHMVMNDDWTIEELYTRRLALIERLMSSSSVSWLHTFILLSAETLPCGATLRQN